MFKCSPARLPWFGAALLLLAFVGGCHDSNSTVIGGLPRKKPYQTVASLSPGATELVLDTSARLIGRTAACNYPSSVLSAPIVANVKPDYEKITSLKPDLVLYDADLFSQDEIDKFKELKIPVAGIGGNTVGEFEKSLYRLAAAAGGETTMMDFIVRIDKARTDAQSSPFQPKPKVAIVMAQPNSNPMIAGTGSFYDDLVRSAGADPVGPDATKFVPISVEALVALNPDVIIVGGPKGDFSSIMNNPQLAIVPAVKKGKVLGVEQDVLFRRGGRVDKAITDIHAGLVTLLK